MRYHHMCDEERQAVHVMLGILGFLGVAFAVSLYYALNQDIDDFPRFPRYSCDDIPLKHMVEMKIRDWMGEKLMDNGHGSNKGHENVEAMWTVKNRFTGFFLMVLADDYKSLEEDVKENNGECKRTCERFATIYKTSVGTLHKKSFKVMFNKMIQLKDPLKIIMTNIIKEIRRNSTHDLLDDARYLSKYPCLKPVRDFFLA